MGNENVEVEEEKAGNFSGFNSAKSAGSGKDSTLKGLLEKLKEVVDHSREVSSKYAKESARKRARLLELRRLGGSASEFTDALISEVSDTVTEMRPELLYCRVLRSRMISTASPVLTKRKPRREC